MLDFDIKPEVLTINSKIESRYFYFRKGVRIKEGLVFQFNPLGRVLVYVGIDGMPVALQLADPVDFQESQSDMKMTYEQAMQILFGLAAKMIAFVEAERKALGNALILDAVKAIKSIKNDCRRNKEDCEAAIA